MVRGGIIVQEKNFFGMEILMLVSCSSITGSEKEKLTKVKKALTMYLFSTYLQKEKLSNPYNYVTNLYSMVRDNWNFVDYNKINYDDYQILQPLQNPKVFYERFLLVEKHHKREIAQNDNSLYLPLISRAFYNNVLR